MGKFKDRTNVEYGRLTAKYCTGINKLREALWMCECSCGNTCIVQGGNLTSKHTRSCGCLHKELTSLAIRLCI